MSRITDAPPLPLHDVSSRFVALNKGQPIVFGVASTGKMRRDIAAGLDAGIYGSRFRSFCRALDRIERERGTSIADDEFCAAAFGASGALAGLVSHLHHKTHFQCIESVARMPSVTSMIYYSGADKEHIYVTDFER